MINKEGKMCKHGTSSRPSEIHSVSPILNLLTANIAICMHNRGFMEDLERGGMPLSSSSEKVARWDLISTRRCEKTYTAHSR
jgi:hypothetical protein